MISRITVSELKSTEDPCRNHLGLALHRVLYGFPFKFPNKLSKITPDSLLVLVLEYQVQGTGDPRYNTAWVGVCRYQQGAVKRWVMHLCLGRIVFGSYEKKSKFRQNCTAPCRYL
jgi:hypothetical protein